MGDLRETVLGNPKKNRSAKTRGKKIINEKAKNNNKTQLKTTGRNVEGEKI